MISISIIIPAYNSEKTIAKCLNAVFTQKNINQESLEVIVVNNNSTDKTSEIASGFDVILINCENQGAAFARNKGIEHARGKFCVFLDSDVELSNDWICECHKKLRSGRYAATQGPIIPSPLDGSSPFLDSLRLKITKVATGKTYNYLEVESFKPIVNTAACMYRKQWLEHVGKFNTALQRGEDRDLSFRVFAAGGAFVTSPNAASKVFWDRGIGHYYKRFFLNGLASPKLIIPLPLFNPEFKSVLDKITVFLINLCFLAGYIVSRLLVHEKRGQTPVRSYSANLFLWRFVFKDRNYQFHQLSRIVHHTNEGLFLYSFKSMRSLFLPQKSYSLNDSDEVVLFEENDLKALLRYCFFYIEQS